MHLWQKGLLLGMAPAVSVVYCFLRRVEAVDSLGFFVLFPIALLLGGISAGLLLPTDALPLRGRLWRRVLLPVATAVGVVTTPFLIILYSATFNRRLEYMGVTDYVAVALSILFGGWTAGVLLRLPVRCGVRVHMLFPLTPGICQAMIGAWLGFECLTPQREFLEMLDSWLHTDYFLWPDYSLAGPTKWQELCFLVITIGLSYAGVLLGHKVPGRATRPGSS